MQSRQLSGCPPPAPYLHRRPAKLRPPWRSVQAVIRSRGGESDDVQTLYKDQDNPIIQAEHSGRPQTRAGTFNSVATSDLSKARSITSTISPGTSATTTEGLSQKLTVETPNLPGPHAAGLASVQELVTGVDVKPKTVTAGKALVRERAALSPLNSLRGVAISVLVMTELFQMLSGNWQELTPAELRGALSNFDITAEDLRKAEAAGVLTPELLQSLGLQPILPAPTPSTLGLPRKTAEDTNAKTASQPPQQKPAQQGSQAQTSNTQPTQSGWSLTPSQDPAVQVMNAVVDAAEVAVVASGALMSPLRTVVSDVLYGVFTFPFASSSVPKSGDINVGGGGDGDGAGGSGGGCGNNGKGGGGGQHEGAGGSGDEMHPRLHSFLQFFAAVNLLLPPDRQLTIMHQLRLTLGSAARGGVHSEDTHESSHTLWLRHPANYRGQRLSSNIWTHRVWRPLDAWYAPHGGLPRAARTTQVGASTFMLSMDPGLQAGAAHGVFSLQAVPLVAGPNAVSVRSHRPASGHLRQWQAVADEAGQKQACEGHPQEKLRLRGNNVWDAASVVAVLGRDEARLLPAEGSSWLGSMTQNYTAVSCNEMARLPSPGQDSSGPTAAGITMAAMVLTKSRHPAFPETQLARTGLGQPVAQPKAHESAHLAPPATGIQSSCPAAWPVSLRAFKDVPTGVQAPSQHGHQHTHVETSANPSQATQSAGHDKARSQPSSCSWSPREVAASSVPSNQALEIPSSQTPSPRGPTLATEVSRLTLILDSRRSTLEHTDLAEAGHAISAAVFPWGPPPPHYYQPPALAADAVADVVVLPGSDDRVQTDLRSPSAAVPKLASPAAAGPVVVLEAPWVSVKASEETTSARMPRSDTTRDQVHPHEMSCGGAGPVDAVQGAVGYPGLVGMLCQSICPDQQGAVDAMAEQSYELDIAALYRKSVSAGGVAPLAPWGMEYARTWPAMPTTKEGGLPPGDSSAGSEPAAGDLRLEDAAVESVDEGYAADDETEKSLPVNSLELQSSASAATAPLPTGSVQSATPQLPEAVSLAVGMGALDTPAESVLELNAGLPVLQDIIRTASRDHQGPPVSLRPPRPPQKAAASVQCPMVSARQPSHVLHLQRANSWNAAARAAVIATRELPRTQSYDFGRHLRAPLGLGGMGLLSRGMLHSSSFSSLQPSGRLRRSSGSEQVQGLQTLIVPLATPLRPSRSPSGPQQNNLVETLSQLSPIEVTAELDPDTGMGTISACGAAATSCGSRKGWSPARAAVAATLVAVPALAATAWIARSSTNAAADALASLSAVTATALVSERVLLSGHVAGGSAAVANSNAALWTGKSTAIAATVAASVIAVPLVAAAYFSTSAAASPTSSRLWPRLSPARHNGAFSPGTAVGGSDGCGKERGLEIGVDSGAVLLPPQSPRTQPLHRVQNAMSQICAAAVAVSGATSEAAWRRLRITTESVRRGLWNEAATSLSGCHTPSAALEASAMPMDAVPRHTRRPFGGIRTELFPQPASPAANLQGSELGICSTAHPDKQQEPVQGIAATSVAHVAGRGACEEDRTQQDSSSQASPLVTTVMVAGQALQPGTTLACSAVRQAAAVAASRCGLGCADATLQAEDCKLPASDLLAVGSTAVPLQSKLAAMLPPRLKQDSGSADSCVEHSDGEEQSHRHRLGSERPVNMTDQPVVAVQANAAHGGSGLALVLLRPQVHGAGQQLLVGQSRHGNTSGFAIGHHDACLTHVAYHRLHAQHAVLAGTEGTSTVSLELPSSQYVRNSDVASPTECNSTGAAATASDAQVAEVAGEIAAQTQASVPAASTSRCALPAILGDLKQEECVYRPAVRLLLSSTGCGSGSVVSSSGGETAGSFLAHGGATTLGASVGVGPGAPTTSQPVGAKVGIEEPSTDSQAAHNLAPDGPHNDICVAGLASGIRDTVTEVQSCTAASVDAEDGALAGQHAPSAAALTGASDYFLAVSAGYISLDGVVPAAASEEGVTVAAVLRTHLFDCTRQGEEQAQHAASRVEDGISSDTALAQPASVLVTTIPAEVGGDGMVAAAGELSAGAVGSTAATQDVGSMAIEVEPATALCEETSAEIMLRKCPCEAATGGEPEAQGPSLASTCVYSAAQSYVPELAGVMRSAAIAITADDTGFPEPIHFLDSRMLCLDEGTLTRCLADGDRGSAVVEVALKVAVARTSHPGEASILQPPAAACSSQAACPGSPQHMVSAGTEDSPQVAAGTKLSKPTEHTTCQEPTTTEALSGGWAVPSAVCVLAGARPAEEGLRELVASSQEPALTVTARSQMATVALSTECLVDTAVVDAVVTIASRRVPCAPSLLEEDAPGVLVSVHGLAVASVTPAEVWSRPSSSIDTSPLLEYAQDVLDARSEAADNAGAGISVEGETVMNVLPSSDIANSPRQLYLADAATLQQELEQNQSVKIAAEDAATRTLLCPIPPSTTIPICSVSLAGEPVQDEATRGGLAKGSGPQADAEGAAEEPVASIPSQNCSTAAMTMTFPTALSTVSTVLALADGHSTTSGCIGAAAAAEAAGVEVLHGAGDVESSFPSSQAARGDISLHERYTQPDAPWWQGAAESRSSDDQSLPSSQSLQSLRVGSRSEVLLLLSPNGSMERSWPVGIPTRQGGSNGGSVDSDSGSVTVIQMLPEPGVEDRGVEKSNAPVLLVELNGDHVDTGKSEPQEQSPVASDAAATPLKNSIVHGARQGEGVRQAAPERHTALNTSTSASSSSQFGGVVPAAINTSIVTPSKIPKPPSVRCLLAGSRSSLPHPIPATATEIPPTARSTSITMKAAGLKGPHRSALCDTMEVGSLGEAAASRTVTPAGPSTFNGTIQKTRSRPRSSGLASSSVCEPPARVAFGRVVDTARITSRAGATQPPYDSDLPGRGGVRTAGTTPLRGITATSSIGTASMAAKSLAQAFDQQAAGAAPKQSNSLTGSRGASLREWATIAGAAPGCRSPARSLNRGGPCEEQCLTGPKQPAAVHTVACTASGVAPIPIRQPIVAANRSLADLYDSGSKEDGFGSPRLSPPPLNGVPSSRPSLAPGPADGSTASLAIHSSTTLEGAAASGRTANWPGVRNDACSCGSSSSNSGRLANMELGVSVADLTAAVAALRPNPASAVMARPSQPMTRPDHSPAGSARSTARPGVSYRPAAHFAPSTLAGSAGDAKPMSQLPGIAGSLISRGSSTAMRLNPQGVVARTAAALERKSADDPRLRRLLGSSSGTIGEGSPLTPNGKGPRRRSERLAKLLLTFDGSPAAAMPSPGYASLTRHSAPLSLLGPPQLHTCSAAHDFVRPAPAAELIFVGGQCGETADTVSGQLDTMQRLHATSSISPTQRPQLPELDTPKSEMDAQHAHSVGLKSGKETRAGARGIAASGACAGELEYVLAGNEASYPVMLGSGCQPLVPSTAMPQLAAANVVEGMKEGANGRAGTIDAAADGQDALLAPAGLSGDGAEDQVRALQEAASDGEDPTDGDQKGDGDHADYDSEDDDRLDPGEEAALAAILAAATEHSRCGVAGAPPERLLAAISTTLQAAADAHVRLESTASQNVDASAKGLSVVPVLHDSAARAASAMSTTSTCKKSNLTTKWKRAFKSLLKGGKSKGSGAASVDAASSVMYSTGASSLPGASDVMSALDGLAALDGFSLAGTSVTDATLASAATAPAGETASTVEARRKRKSLWKRLKRKLGKMVGVIPRSWEVHAQQLAAAAQAAEGLSTAAAGRTVAAELGVGGHREEPATAEPAVIAHDRK